jgi:excisionase family DNA binding protein
MQDSSGNLNKLEVPDMPTANQFLTVHEVAAMFGVSRATIWRRVQDGTLPQPVKIGRATRFSQSEIELAAERLMEGRD